METNGARPKGRFAGAYPSYTTQAGYTVQIRRISPDTPARLRTVAERELAGDKPEVPTEQVRMAGPELGGQPIDQDIPRPDNPDYQAALKAWQDRVRMRSAEKLRDLIGDYAIITEVDLEAVNELRQAYAAQGDDLSAETDRQIWIWRIVAPTRDDQFGVMGTALGTSVPTKEAIQAEKDVFPGNVSEEKHLDPGHGEG